LHNLENFELRMSTLSGEKDLVIILPRGYGLNDLAPKDKIFKCTGVSGISYYSRTPYGAISSVMSEERVITTKKIHYLVELVDDK
jgi:hypothetical protein